MNAKVQSIKVESEAKINEIKTEKQRITIEFEQKFQECIAINEEKQRLQHKIDLLEEELKVVTERATVIEKSLFSMSGMR